MSVGRTPLCLRVVLAAVLAVCLTTPGVFAGEQFAGEVLKVDVAVNKLTVKKPDGNRFTFTVNAKTAFTGGRKTLQDLSKGDRVTVEFQNERGQYMALKVITP